MRKLKVKIFSGFFIFYLWLLTTTCKIRIINECHTDINNSIIGFWHGESFPMYLLMKQWTGLNIAAVATSDPRGDYIDTIMKKYNIKPLRLPNGIAARHGINDIIKIGKSDKSLCICFSIDGPLGPFHQPKKMVFHIAHYCEKKYLGIHIDVKGKYVIKSRWDKYLIPLPFSRMTYTVKNFGEISKEQIKNYDQLSKDITNFMEGN